MSTTTSDNFINFTRQSSTTDSELNAQFAHGFSLNDRVGSGDHSSSSRQTPKLEDPAILQSQTSETLNAENASHPPGISETANSNLGENPPDHTDLTMAAPTHLNPEGHGGDGNGAGTEDKKDTNITASGIPLSNTKNSSGSISYLPGTASLVEEVDKKQLVMLRDGRMLIGVLRSVDQFANLVLQNTIERVLVNNEFCDIGEF